jgi:hypothetical protein
MRMSSVVYGMMQGAFAVLYAALLYANAATASLSDNYFNGIEALKHWFNPSGLLIIVVLMCTIIRKPQAKLFASHSVIAAWLMCIFVYALQHGLEYVDFPVSQDRSSLSAVLYQSLFQPSFSGRSTVAIIATAALTTLTYEFNQCFNATKATLEIHFNKITNKALSAISMVAAAISSAPATLAIYCVSMERISPTALYIFFVILTQLLAGYVLIRAPRNQKAKRVRTLLATGGGLGFSAAAIALLAIAHRISGFYFSMLLFLGAAILYGRLCARLYCWILRFFMGRCTSNSN